MEYLPPHPTFLSPLLPEMEGFHPPTVVVPSVAPTVLSLNQLFSSNMVLQRAPKASSMWGMGVPSSTITIQVDGDQLGSTTVDGSGYWLIRLTPRPLHHNATVTVSDGTTDLRLDSVAFGDVYLCSGQSNMVLTLNFTFGGPEKVAQWASYPYLRLYNIQQYQYSATPLNESRLSYPGWVQTTPQTLSAYPADYSTYFSSVCFWAGAEVYDSLGGKVPIGLVQSSYGGTCVEPWTSAATVDQCGPYKRVRSYNDQDYNNASVVYNAMIHPLLNMAFTAVLWYQGNPTTQPSPLPSVTPPLTSL